MAGQAHRQTRSTHAPYWCDDCGRAHTGTHDDAQGILGASGALGSIGYAWCSRESAYHYSTEPRATARAMMRVAPTAHKVRLRWTTNVAQPSRKVRVNTHPDAARIFALSYNAQRSRPAPCVRGCGNGLRISERTVTITQPARAALAAVNVWGTPERTAQRIADMHALDARISARG
jgi:hypothetical protein